MKIIMNRFAPGFYFIIGTTLMLVFTWRVNSESSTLEYIKWGGLVVGFGLLSGLIVCWKCYEVLKKTWLLGITGLVCFVIAFFSLKQAPYAVGICGVTAMATAYSFFQGLQKQRFQNEKLDAEISHLVHLVSGAFVVFVSALMVGFILGYYNSYISNSSLEIREYAKRGINANLLTTLYYWLGIILIILSSIAKKIRPDNT